VRTEQTLFRFAAAAAIGGLVMGPGLAPLARAQDTPATQGAPPAPGAPASPDAAPVDPPARVGRVAALLGTVSFHTADETTWQAATLNYPVTTGNDFWTEPTSAAEIEVDATHLAMDQDTEFDLDTLDDHTFAGTTPQGAVYLRIRNFLPGDADSVTTPRGVVTITAAGRYEVVAGDTDQPTRVTVLEGGADIAVGNVTLHVAPHQTAAITGSAADNFQGSVGVETVDPFLTAQLAKERPAPRPVATGSAAVATVVYQPPPVVANMTGYDAIADTGTWAQAPEYGHVWYPPVQRDWVPYRHGHWAFVAPWGWTWVDDASWGFAPFHYGRWVQVHERWGWIPTDPGVPVQPNYVRPVYAPALVSFVNVGAAAAVGAAVGVAAGLALGASVGWIPLGPREPYVPPFRASPTYVRNVNVTQVRNVTNITNTTIVNNYVNRGAATVVPAAAMTGSRPVAAAFRPVTPQQLAAARPIPAAQAPLAPTLATAGVTPVVAQQMHIAPAANAAAIPARPRAPGPAVVARPAVAVGPAARVNGAAIPVAHALPPVAPASSAKPAALTVQPATPAEQGKPGAPQLHAEPVKPGTPQIQREPVKPGAPQMHAEPMKPGTRQIQGEPGKPGAPQLHAEPAKPGAPQTHVEPVKPGAPQTHGESAKPAVPEPAKLAAPHTTAGPAHMPVKPATEPSRPEPVRSTAARPEPARPAPTAHVEPAALHPAPAHQQEPKKACPNGERTC
jgi:hypothetical protein